MGGPGGSGIPHRGCGSCCSGSAADPVPGPDSLVAAGAASRIGGFPLVFYRCIRAERGSGGFSNEVGANTGAVAAHRPPPSALASSGTPGDRPCPSGMCPGKVWAYERLVPAFQSGDGLAWHILDPGDKRTRTVRGPPGLALASRRIRAGQAPARGRGQGELSLRRPCRCRACSAGIVFRNSAARKYRKCPRYAVFAQGNPYRWCRRRVACGRYHRGTCADCCAGGGGCLFRRETGFPVGRRKARN